MYGYRLAIFTVISQCACDRYFVDSVSTLVLIPVAVYYTQ